MGEPLLGWPKGGRGRLVEVAPQQRFNFPFFSTIIVNNYYYFRTLILIEGGHLMEVQLNL